MWESFAHYNFALLEQNKKNKHKQTDITKIYLHTLSGNIRAQNSFRKAGFNFKKIVKKASHEFHFMEISKSDWQKNKDLSKPEVIVGEEQD